MVRAFSRTSVTRSREEEILFSGLSKLSPKWLKQWLRILQATAQLDFAFVSLIGLVFTVSWSFWTVSTSEARDCYHSIVTRIYIYHRLHRCIEFNFSWKIIVTNHVVLVASFNYSHERSFVNIVQYWKRTELVTRLYSFSSIFLKISTLLDS